MSLIQEALKRKDDENSGIPPKAVPVVPAPPPRLAIKQPEIPVSASVSPVKEKTSRAWPVLVISLLMITVLALGAVGLLLYSARSLAQGGPQQAKGPNAEIENRAPLATVPAPVPPPVEPVVAAAPEPARAAPPAPVLDPVKPVAEAAPVADTVTPAPAEVTPMVFSISTGIVKEGTTEKKPEPVEVSVVPVSRPVMSQSLWPLLKVIGVMVPRSAAQAGAAIIDGNLVECGDEIRGVRVQGVDKSGVWFEFRSQTQYVRVGQTTR